MAEPELGPLDMEDTFNIIRRNLDNSSDVLALASTSKTMASRAAGQLSSIHVPLFKRLLVTEEQTEKAELYRTILKQKRRKRFLGWYWNILDSRFLSLYDLTQHWMKPYEFSLPESKVTRTVNQNLNSIAAMLITYTSRSPRLSPEFFRAYRRYVTGERLSYKELSDTTISLFQLFRPNLLAFLPTGAKEEFLGLLTAFQLAENGTTSRYFNDLVETRLAYICAVVFSVKRAFASNPSGEFDNRRNEFAYLTSFLRLCLSDTETFSSLATRCQLFAQQVEQASQRVAVSILEWRFGKEFIKDAEIAKTGSLQEPETVTSFEIATEFVTRAAQSVLAIQLRDLNVVSAFFLHCLLQMSDQSKPDRHFTLTLAYFLLNPRSEPDRIKKELLLYERSFDSYSQRRPHSQIDRKFFRWIVDPVVKFAHQNFTSPILELRIDDILVDVGIKVRSALSPDW